MNSRLSEIQASRYQIFDCSKIFSPGLLVFKELLLENLNEVLRIAGGPQSLRPHCKTHKMPAIVQMMAGLGIDKQKCATLAEAEMLAEAGCRDILLAYQMVGPNVERFVNLVDKFPDTKFACLIDDQAPLNSLGEALESRGLKAHALLDVDPGMRRTGIEPGDDARELYEMIASTPGIVADGIHWYDGHHRETEFLDRVAEVQGAWFPLTQLRDQLMLEGLPVPKVVVAGTGSFPVLADLGEPNLELTPGTTTLYDIGYFEKFPDLKLTPAAAVLTRVISKNRSGYLTLDAGHKSISPDSPAGQRTFFPQLPDAVEVSQNEEHLVLRSGQADEFKLGDPLIALPRHICPTSALHQTAYVIEAGKVVDEWPVAARDRRLTV